MSSPLFNLMGGQPTGGPLQMIQQFMQFKNGFTGNAQAEVEKLMNSGRFNQQQINQAYNMARQLQGMLGMIK